jgi:hypothetical protein
MAGAPKQQIGSATMENDGTIVMRLRLTQGAAVGDVEKRYAPGTPDYQEVRAHQKRRQRRGAGSLARCDILICGQGRGSVRRLAHR